MKYEIVCRPSYSMVRFKLDAGESIKAEGDAMVCMGEHLNIKTETGGVWKAITRSVLAGESMFLNTFTAEQKTELSLSSPFPGDIVACELDGTMYVQPTSYLASSPEISIGTKFAGLKGLLSKEGIFFLKLEGQGKVFLAAFGGLLTKAVKSGETFIIDNGYLVAYSSGMDFSIGKAGGWKTFVLGGEAIVAKFRGSGTVFYQTKSEANFARWLVPFLPKKGGGD